MSDYTIRRFRPGDRADLLRLYDVAFGLSRSEEWFAWKYQDNPYFDHVPAFVAEHDDTVVGTMQWFPHQITDGTDTWCCLQPCDGMVDPEHRRNGLFDRVSRAALDYYADRDVDLTLGIGPNELSRPAMAEIGWVDVGTIPIHHRFNDFGSVVAERTDSTALALLGRVATPAVRAYNAVRSWTAPTPRDDVETTVHETVPVDALTELYERSAPSGRLHVPRDETFYEWRFENPAWEYRTVLASDGDGPVSAAVVGRSRTDDGATARITEALPLDATDPRPLAPVVERVLEEYADVDKLSAFGSTVPGAAQWGFLSNQRFPLSRFSFPIYAMTRLPGQEGECTLDGYDLTDPSNWQLSYAACDTS